MVGNREMYLSDATQIPFDLEELDQNTVVKRSI